MPLRPQPTTYPSISTILDQHSSVCGATTSRTHLLSRLSQVASTSSLHECHDDTSSDSQSESLSRTESRCTACSSRCAVREECERRCLRRVSRGFALLQKSLSIKSSAATVREFWHPEHSPGGGDGGVARARNDSMATTVVVSRLSTGRKSSSIYRGLTLVDGVHHEDDDEDDGEKKKELREGGWIARCKAKAKRLRSSRGRYEELEECESEKVARKEAKRQTKEQKRTERREWLLATGSDFSYGYHDIYGVSVGGAVDWRFCMGMVF